MMRPTRTSQTTMDWKLFVCNTYQIAAPFVNRFNETCKRQGERGKLLGELIKREKPDLVFLQEMWGGGQRPLELALASAAPTTEEGNNGPRTNESSTTSTTTSYFVPNALRSWWGWSVLDTAVQYSKRRGGLWYSYNDSAVTELHDGGAIKFPFQHTFTFSNSGSKKGVMVTKFTRSASVSSSDRSHLIVFNTHLDPTNENDGIVRQLKELRDVIVKVVTSETSPSKRGANLSAVVVGDFNITPGSTLYKQLFNIMGSSPSGGVVNAGMVDNSSSASSSIVVLRELLPEASKKIPTYDAKNPMVLWPQSQGRLDHIFAIDGIVSETGGASISLSRVELAHDAVLNAAKDDIVSDHYPITATLRVFD